MSWQILGGDCIERMGELDEASVDAIVTDPPYGLEFMGKEWDRLEGKDAPGYTERPRMTGDHMGKGFRSLPNFYMAGTKALAWHLAWATEALRVLKPGGHLLAFGGTRTYHRLACAIEDAGFEIRDTIAWLYGSGFPKSKNLDGEWPGWGTALKPAFEPIVLARKPLIGTVEVNVQTHRTGALNIDGTRIDYLGEADQASAIPQGRATAKSGALAGGTQHDGDRSQFKADNTKGRWPANVALDEEAAAMLDEQAGERPSGYAHVLRRGRTTGKGMGYQSSAAGDVLDATYGDSGGASRFFYCPKADREERDRGLVDFPERPLLWSSSEQSPGTFQAEGTNRSARNYHPTVKPIALMAWLCRLVTPPNGLILDPFAGSGSTGIAALREGFDFIGIEREHEYVEIARARIVGDAPLFNVEST